MMILASLFTLLVHRILFLFGDGQVSSYFFLGLHWISYCNLKVFLQSTRAVIPTAELAGVKAHSCPGTATLQVMEREKAARNGDTQHMKIHVSIFWKWKM